MAETTQPSPEGEPDEGFLTWRYIVAGALVSAAIWFIAPFVQDRREPWDSPYFLYRGGLLISGIILGASRPKPYVQGIPSAWLGAWIGQLPFVLTSEFRTLGVVATAFGSLFFAGGTFIGTMFRLGWRKKQSV